MIPVKVKIINNDGKVTEIVRPYSIVAVGDRVTISYPEQKQAVQRVLVEYSNGDLTALLINRIDCLLYSLAKKYLPPESED